jgi:F-type H+-transporting ATPase subunit c
MTLQVIDTMIAPAHSGAMTNTPIDLLPLAVALLIGIPAFGSCIGIGLATMKFLEGVARQPELAPSLQTKYFLAVGVTDGAFIIATGIGLWFATANPFR